MRCSNSNRSKHCLERRFRKCSPRHNLLLGAAVVSMLAKSKLVLRSWLTEQGCQVIKTEGWLLDFQLSSVLAATCLLPISPQRAVSLLWLHCGRSTFALRENNAARFPLVVERWYCLWKLMKRPNTAVFIKTSYAYARKYLQKIFGITETPSDSNCTCNTKI